MPLDALTLSVLTEELSKTLVGGKITKISQPEKDEVSLHVYNGRGFLLLASASASLPRLHLTEESKENPAAAPSFCMLLRKHLSGGQIVRVWQQAFERVTVFDILASDELGDKTEKHLICELTGKSSNIFLTNADFKILGALKSVPLSSLSDRPTLPGQTFQFLTQDKISPDNTEAIYAALQKSQPENVKEFLKEKILGISWTTLNEIATGNNFRTVADGFKHFLEKLKTPMPQLVIGKSDVPSDVLAVDYASVDGERKFYPSLNEAFDAYFLEKDKALRHGEKTRRITQIVRNALKRTENKIALQKETLLSAQSNETNRIYGDLVLSNLHRIKRGDKLLVAENFCEQSCPQVRILLDELLTPQQNAQRYYKKYAKFKKTAEFTQKLLEENERQLKYLQSILQSLANPLQNSDIDDILSELQQLKLGDKQQQKGKTQAKKKPKPLAESKPLRYEIEGFTVLVGKNNVQNDRLTFGVAKPDDIWMHAKNLHSSHVIIQNPHGQTVPDKVLEICAEITAYFSEARDSSKVPVDYTLKKNVKKPGGSPPGFVRYDCQQSCLANPNRHASMAKC